MKFFFVVFVGILLFSDVHAGAFKRSLPILSCLVNSDEEIRPIGSICGKISTRKDILRVMKAYRIISPTDSVDDYMQKSEDPRNNVEILEQTVNHCILFSPYVGDNIRYLCDYNKICADKSRGFYRNVILNSSAGDLYCCNEPNCNSLEEFRKAMQREKAVRKPVASSCYSGLSLTNVGKKSCENNANGCRSITVYLESPITFYGCNDVYLMDFCIEFELARPGCQNLSFPFMRSNVTLCCCFASDCNKPSVLYGFSNPDVIRIGFNNPSLLTSRQLAKKLILIVVLLLCGFVGGLVMTNAILKFLLFKTPLNVAIIKLMAFTLGFLSGIIIGLLWVIILKLAF